MPSISNEMFAMAGCLTTINTYYFRVGVKISNNLFWMPENRPPVLYAELTDDMVFELKDE